jgi:hypothetical protein
MSKEEFIARKGNGCADIKGEFTEKLDQNLVKEITLRFSSGTPSAEMIVAISEQFSARPTKPDWSTEITHATNPHLVHMPLGEYVWAVGGLIAKWRLDDNLSLNLTLNRPAAGANPNEYFLTLASDALAKLEVEAEQKRRKDEQMRARAINPTQRF